MQEFYSNWSNSSPITNPARSLATDNKHRKICHLILRYAIITPSAYINQNFIFLSFHWWYNQQNNGVRNLSVIVIKFFHSFFLLTFSNSACAAFLSISMGPCMSSISSSCFLHFSLALVYSFWQASTVSWLTCTSVLDASNTGDNWSSSRCILFKLFVASSILLMAFSKWAASSCN